ncbi:NADPH-dependent diflavin oxidoreductase 1 [Coemansia sp. Benny D160-2]|nr:NADPH-dependent diflavin oxidoreductase 1 [Coemansia sp. Benny D160-2]
MEAPSERKLVVLYGSQTGYAEDAARRIGREAWRRHYAVQVAAMDHVERSLVFETEAAAILFVCSTTGQGDPPDNMRKFWRFLLRKTIPHDALRGKRVAVFGLGDSSYSGFNFAAKRLFRRLVQLGAVPLVPRGDGDDQHYLGVDGALDPWLQDLWTELERSHPLPRPIVPESVVPPPSADVALDGDIEMHGLGAPPEPPLTVAATLAESERITAQDHFQDVRRLRFETDDAVEWVPGDCAVLRPCNQARDVDAFLAAAGWTALADRRLRISGETVATWVPRTTTLRWLGTYYFDIGGVPRRSFFEMLRHFARTEAERERLCEFASTAGQDDLLTYCMRPRRTFTETLRDFRHTAPLPLEYAFDLVPPIAERSFSISSARGPVDLTVAVVTYKTVMRDARRGVCSTWLAQLKPGERVRMRLARGTMRPPPDPLTPAIMVGPGTGIAAFMAFMHQRCALAQSPNYLFFGCRSEHKDFYYRSTLERWCAAGSLHLFCAFSRDNDPEKKVYVQHRIREQGALVWSLLDGRRACVYVSGNANKMPQDVRAAFVDVVAAHGARSADDAAEYVRAMERDGRYQEECWY